jgi:hypothetical protein
MKVPIYIVYAYRDGSFYPDLTARRHSRIRAERAADRLRREGFGTKLLAPAPRLVERAAGKS